MECTHGAPKNLSGFGKPSVQGRDNSSGRLVTINRVDQIGKYFKNNEKYISCQQRRKLQIQKKIQFQLTLWHWIGIGNIGIL